MTKITAKDRETFRKLVAAGKALKFLNYSARIKGWTLITDACPEEIMCAIEHPLTEA